MYANRHTYTHASCNAVTLVWGLLRLAQINYFCVQWVKIFSSVHWRMKLRICTTVPDYFSSMYRSLTKKGPWAVHMHHFVLRQGGGRIFVTSLHFTTKKCPCLHCHNLHTTGYCTQTHPPSTSFCVCISQACVASHKWTSGSILTFQGVNVKVHCWRIQSPYKGTE